LTALAERLPAAVAAPSGATRPVAQDAGLYFVSDVGPDDEDTPEAAAQQRQRALKLTPDVHHKAIITWGDREA
jgi:hypothetical protein